jgi:dephospho-CoA kinase
VILKAGLTGGIASGKSTIARLFGELGCIVLDADALVAELYRPGNAGHRALVATYGSEILRDDGEVDRQKLANVAFTDSASAQKLNALIHPLVLEEEARIAAEEARRRDGEDAIYVVEATLLLEAGGKQRYDRIIVVDVDPATQVARGVARGMSREEVERRIRHQLPRAERLAAADYVIDNGRDLEQAKREVRRVYDALRGDLAARSRA